MGEAAVRSSRPGASPRGPVPWAILVAVVVAVVGLVALLLTFQTLQGSIAWGYDFEAYRNAASRLAESGSLYQPETLVGPFRPGPYGLYLYPPPLGVVIRPFTDVPIEVGAAAWFLLHVGALALACAVLPVSWTIRLLVFGIGALSFGVIRDFVLGNVSVLLLPFLAIAWRYLDRPTGSIATACSIAIRPTVGLLLIWQLLRRRWDALAWTVGAGLVLIVLTLPVVGLVGYSQYVTVLRNLSDITGVAKNIDLGSTLLGLVGDPATAQVALLAGYVVAIIAMLASLRRDRELGFMVTLGASMLLSPLLWDHYLAALLLPAAFLASRGRPIGLLLPLLSWLPPPALPFVVIVATVAPFWARERVPEGRPPEPVASAVPSPA